jgi:hypothetical protein
MTEQRYPLDRAGHLADEGATTQDLGGRIAGKAARPVPAPAGEWYTQPSAEQHIRHRGQWMIICGATITLLTAALSIVWAAGFEQDLPIGVVLPLHAFGLGGITMGMLEYLARPHRNAQQRCLDRIDQLELAMLDLVGLMDEDKQQAFYSGAAWQVRNQSVAGRTGTENARPLNKYRTEGVVPFRQRNNG